MMPLSKARNKHRMRLNRLHALLSPPQDSKPVQPKAANVLTMGKLDPAVKTVRGQGIAQGPCIPELDADGNRIYEEG